MPAIVLVASATCALPSSEFRCCQAPCPWSPIHAISSEKPPSAGSKPEAARRASGGAESYSIQISTGNGDASYSLVFAPSPTAVDDFYSVAEDITLSVTDSESVVLNDVSPNSQLHHVSLVDSPSHGDLTLNTDGTFSYVPDDEYSGLDSFTYRFDDDLAVSDVATVTIEITAVNDIVSDST